VLPAWARNPEHFIYMHRKALESDYVSDHLNDWIDLIFGYKQTGVEAEKALNVFMYCTYEGAIDVDAISDPVARRATEDMISNFGQTPTQLFKEAHPKRRPLGQALINCELLGRPMSLFLQLNYLKAFYIEVSPLFAFALVFTFPLSRFFGKVSDKKAQSYQPDPIVYISIPHSHIKPFMQQGPTDPLITITSMGMIGVHGWQTYDRSVRSLFSFEKDPALLNEK
jgi:hypothetical protein